MHDICYFFNFRLEVHIGTHAARNAKSGSNSRSYRHDELNNQLPSVLFRFSTHNAIFLLNINFLEVRGEISHKRTCPDCRTLRTCPDCRTLRT